MRIIILLNRNHLFEVEEMHFLILQVLLRGDLIRIKLMYELFYMLENTNKIITNKKLISHFIKN